MILLNFESMLLHWSMKWMKPFLHFFFVTGEWISVFQEWMYSGSLGIEMVMFAAKRKTLHKPWDAIKTFFYLYILVMKVFEMHCLTLLATLMQIQIKHKIILADENVLHFNTEMFIAWNGVKIRPCSTGFCINIFLYFVHTRKNSVVIHECKFFQASQGEWTLQELWFLKSRYWWFFFTFSFFCTNEHLLDL